MTPAALGAAATLLHGTRWKLALSEALDVDYRLVRRWASGERPIPGWVEPALRIELRGRADEIRKFLEGTLTNHRRRATFPPRSDFHPVISPPAAK